MLINSELTVKMTKLVYVLKLIVINLKELWLSYFAKSSEHLDKEICLKEFCMMAMLKITVRSD